VLRRQANEKEEGKGRNESALREEPIVLYRVIHSLIGLDIVRREYPCLASDGSSPPPRIIPRDDFDDVISLWRI
jgi:hypothetical protein